MPTIDKLNFDTIKESYNEVLKIRKQNTIDEVNSALLSLHNQLDNDKNNNDIIIPQLKEEIVKLEKQIEKLSSDLTSASKSYNSTVTKKQAATKNVEEQNNLVLEKNNEISILVEKIESDKNKIAEKEAELKSMEESIIELKKLFDKSKLDYDNKLIKKVDLNKVEKSYNSALKKRDTIASNIEKATTTVLQPKKDELETKKKELKKLEDKLTNLVNKQIELERNSNNALNLKQEIETKLNNLNSTKEKNAETISNLEAGILTNEQIKSIKKEIEQKEKELKDIEKRDTATFTTLDTFKNFLSSNNLSTVHAEDLHNLFLGNNKLSALTDFKMRKKHRKRDWILKKGGTLVGLAGGSVWGIISTIIASQMPAGSMFLGFIPVTGNIVATALSAGIPMALLGAGITYGYFKLKKVLTIAAHKKVYSTAKEAIADLDSTELEKLDIVKCLNIITEKKKKILQLREGKWYTAVPRFIARHFLNAKNRNRLHHVEQFTKDLVEELDSSYSLWKFQQGEDKKQTKAKIDKIVKLLSRIDKFTIEDNAESKLFAFITCKEKGKHSHADIIENIDIYSNLATYLDKVTMLNPENKEQTKQQKQQVSSYKRTIKRYNKKHDQAEHILNDEKTFIQKLLGRYNLSTTTDPKPQPLVLTNYGINLNSITLNLNDGRSIVVNDVQNTTNIRNVLLNEDNKTITIVYEGGTTIVQPIIKKVNNIGNVNNLGLTIQAEAKILTSLIDYRRNLIGAGFNPNQIDDLITILTDYQSRKPKKCFKTSKKFKVGNYSAIYNEVINMNNNHIQPIAPTIFEA